ncbi:Adaptive-response sensory-kinase SasA [Austwickia sp. TVS 96-490-7B]|uniref:sensor histidine kinase n=1 Tax=Austwickia sp. TVS 96-490-7B TaxID=2830843 RepID=UPI001DD33150|nr:HAMP domain-containing sensor histidine kinase [Austwickia sp. TVS 96-490-7B]MBW3085529.1 Adaptive-response sensory-kinase SasA [Austwickia sp. TVS 96-490-7B]
MTSPVPAPPPSPMAAVDTETVQRRYRPSREWFQRTRRNLADPLRTWPLTWRLVAVLVVMLVTALGLNAVATQIVLRTYLMDRAAAELHSAGKVAAENSLYQVATRGHVYTPGVPTSYALLFMNSEGGSPVGLAAADENNTPTIPSLTFNDQRVTGNKPFIVGSSDDPDTKWQVVAGRLTDGSGVYAVAMPLRGIDETIARLQALSLAIGLVVAASSATVGFLGVKRAFRPLRQMEDTAAAIADGDLTQRVPEHPADDEVASLSRSLNAMLSQIESSFSIREASEERMRRFVTDASHELRTPLATVRGYAELYRQGAASGPEATAVAMKRIEDEATRMSGLVEDLLTLARLDNRRPMNIGEVDLTVLAADAVQDARAREPERNLRLIGLGDRQLGPAMVRGDEARLRQVVTNLIANALQHTPAGSPVEIAVGPLPTAKPARRPGRSAAAKAQRHDAGAAYRIEVRDHGPGIAENEIERVFQRFYRGDPSRGRASGGSGLGLAIVMAIVTAHAGRVGVRATPGGGATFVVELPRSTPTPGREHDDRPEGTTRDQHTEGAR